MSEFTPPSLTKNQRILNLAIDTELRLDKGVIKDYRVALSYLVGLRQVIIIYQPSKFRDLQSEIEKILTRISLKYEGESHE